MSYIHEALKKAQRERESQSFSYRGMLATVSKRAGIMDTSIWRGSLILALIFISLAGAFLVLHYSAREKQAPTGRRMPGVKARPSVFDLSLRKLYEKARSFQRQGRLKEAKRVYRQVIKRDPRFADAINNLGVIYLREGDFTSARKSFEKAARVSPGYADPYYNLACLFALSHDTEHSLSNLEKAVSLEEAVREWARRDPDLESIKGSRRFETIVGDRRTKTTRAKMRRAF